MRTFPVVHFSSLLEECVTVSPAGCVLEMEVDSIECVFFVHLFIKSIIREYSRFLTLDLLKAVLSFLTLYMLIPFLSRVPTNFPSVDVEVIYL